MVLRRCLKIVDELSKRNIHVQDNPCSFCRICSKTLSHLMFECDFHFMVLTRLISSFQNFYLRPTISQDLEHNRGFSVAKNLKSSTLFILNAIIYFLGTERNNRRFNSSVVFTATLSNKISRAIKRVSPK
ncbi:hypothetical protein KFK09_020677 [Dendrobium nobile]|uniref:Reverse transcriptase zinc-binding domain-containing protein n=1 Tax=Dendrobium nobile TaxID=94219 RepID=A0A8T3AMX6_DENNO|nr:hypothetical protein KFK09_020677 [Dendrobium nobile]